MEKKLKKLMKRHHYHTLPFAFSHIHVHKVEIREPIRKSAAKAW